MRDTATFWQHPSFPDMGLLKARFTRHRYELHTHPTYVVALITHGCERLRVGGRRIVAPVNTVIVVNPEEAHDGEPGVETGWSYRTFYPSVRMMTDVARELGHDENPWFPDGLIDDPALAGMLAAAHRTAERADDDAEASMLAALRYMLARYATGRRQPHAGDHSGAGRRIGVYRDVVEADPCRSLDLQSLAWAAGVTRFQVIRDFKVTTGLTPGAYVRNRRLQLARGLIAQGAGLAEAAAAAGFSDQSHLSRVFRRSQGITPGMFRQAWNDRRTGRTGM
jgi:AraC-like DNA-binding protein